MAPPPQTALQAPPPQSESAAAASALTQTPAATATPETVEPPIEETAQEAPPPQAVETPDRKAAEPPVDEPHTHVPLREVPAPAEPVAAEPSADERQTYDPPRVIPPPAEPAAEPAADERQTYDPPRVIPTPAEPATVPASVTPALAVVHGPPSAVAHPPVPPSTSPRLRRLDFVAAVVLIAVVVVVVIALTRTTKHEPPLTARETQELATIASANSSRRISPTSVSCAKNGSCTLSFASAGGAHVAPSGESDEQYLAGRSAGIFKAAFAKTSATAVAVDWRYAGGTELTLTCTRHGFAELLASGGASATATLAQVQAHCTVVKQGAGGI